MTVTKGKTTKFTGTREIVCREDRFPNRRPSDKLFRLSDITTTKELGTTFDRALNNIELKQSVLVKHCGTSIQMIEQHY